MTAAGVVVVNAAEVPWVSGEQVFDSMEPAFRDHLGGDPERVRRLLAAYHLKVLWLDPGSTRRIDHVRADPGYADLGEAYHDSVEEAYFLDGRAELSAEGTMVRGDYFWRPPGWVHSASSSAGFECLLMMEGDAADESSGRVSRVVRPAEEAGRHALGRDADPIGPRGYVRRAESRFMPWQDDDGDAMGLPSHEVGAKVLSRNVRTGSSTRLLRLPAGWQGSIPAVGWDRFLVNTAGSWSVDGQTLDPCSLVHVPAGRPGPVAHAPSGVELLVKAGPR